MVLASDLSLPERKKVLLWTEGELQHPYPPKQNKMKHESVSVETSLPDPSHPDRVAGMFTFLGVGVPSRELVELLQCYGKVPWSQDQAFSQPPVPMPLFCLNLLFCKHLILVTPLFLFQNGPSMRSEI